MGRRLAILKVTREQLKREIKPENYLLIEHDLKLPGGAIITGISEHLLFDEDLVAVRIECPDFREVAEGCKIPFVSMAMDDQEKFVGWIGAAVEVAKLGGYLIPTYAGRWEWEPPSPWLPAVPMKPGSIMNDEAFIKQTFDSLIRLPTREVGMCRNGRCDVEQEVIENCIFGLMKAYGDLVFHNHAQAKAAWVLGGHPTVMTRITHSDNKRANSWIVLPHVQMTGALLEGHIIHWRSQGPFTIYETREQALAEFESLIVSSTINGGGWSPAVPMKPSDTFTMNGETHVVTESGSSAPICICPAADMLADGWKCNCGASK